MISLTKTNTDTSFSYVKNTAKAYVQSVFHQSEKIKQRFLSKISL